MAGEAQNQETVARGGSITLDVYFYSYSGGPLVDPDTTPTYEIKDPNGTSMVTGSGTRVSTGYYTATYTVPNNGELSDEWRIDWTATINGFAVSDAWEYFEVVATGAVGFDLDNTATITDYWLNMIKKPLAYPSIDNIILTDDEIKAYCVYPALRDYFTKFPIRDTQRYALSTSAETEIDFPDNDTFGVLDARVVGKETISGEGSSFWDIVYHQTVTGSKNTGGVYGKAGYNPNYRRQIESFRRDAISSETNRSTFHCRVEEENSLVIIYTNTNGEANITWAKSSSDFSDVRFVYQMDVVKLSQAYLMEHLAQTAGLITNDLPVNVDADTLRNEAKELRESVMERWNLIPDMVVLRTT